MTVQELIDDLSEIDDKSIDINLYDYTTEDTFELLSVNNLMYESKVELTFST